MNTLLACLLLPFIHTYIHPSHPFIPFGRFRFNIRIHDNMPVIDWIRIRMHKSRYRTQCIYRIFAINVTTLGYGFWFFSYISGSCWSLSFIRFKGILHSWGYSFNSIFRILFLLLITCIFSLVIKWWPFINRQVMYVNGMLGDLKEFYSSKYLYEKGQHYTTLLLTSLNENNF